jgi:hypothetical protein
MKPQIIFEAAGIRIVRFTLPPEKRGPDPHAEDNGVREYIEVADGIDLMGQTRWTQLDRKSAGVSDYVRVVNALKAELLKEKV